ncbi:c-type cytochrome [Flavobacterium frigoris]|uniref:Cytochrome c, class I n=1 Tax=Flavobacterium frigoris (strain PS1) TaxID=1086011 RepID=H7FPB2_FLAFP|nr:c-type cytochrome [Flavobacterium frigoris]EIA09592.1 cytochrome c, class I [Flavobacterium frigoris PS1]
MRKFQYRLVVLSSILIMGCQQKTKQTESLTTETSINVSANTSDSLTIDLVELQKTAKLKNTIIVTVNEDPVYHARKRYNAIPFPQLLETHSKIKQLQIDKYQIVFECEDGYKPMMPLRKILSAKSFLAVSDLDAPKGESWSKIIKDGREMKAAPFYLIYQGVSPKDTDFKWPYNLIKVHLVPSVENVSLLLPKGDTTATTGFELFNKNCISCHAINKIGGSMGPELNYPKSVTEYWDQNQLKKFIQNPASFRNGVKMPKLANLNEKKIESIVYYLNYMANHKLQN